MQDDPNDQPIDPHKPVTQAPELSDDSPTPNPTTVNSNPNGQPQNVISQTDGLIGNVRSPEMQDEESTQEAPNPEVIEDKDTLERAHDVGLAMDDQSEDEKHPTDPTPVNIGKSIDEAEKAHQDD